jgi:hypothetical protein
MAKKHDKYFEWLVYLTTENRYEPGTYDKLLKHLYDTEFTFILPMDENRALKGIDLRRRFNYDYARCDDSPCSILEVMVALAITCEEEYMDDPTLGDRTQHWFWRMVTNLGLGGVTDDRYDPEFVSDVLIRFLNREYSYDGKGGLFYIKNPPQDLTTVEIWKQFCWYLDNLI